MQVMSSLHLRLRHLTPGVEDHVREEKVLRTLSLFPSMVVVFLPYGKLLHLRLLLLITFDLFTCRHLRSDTIIQN